MKKLFSFKLIKDKVYHFIENKPLSHFSINSDTNLYITYAHKRKCERHLSRQKGRILFIFTIGKELSCMIQLWGTLVLSSDAEELVKRTQSHRCECRHLSYTEISQFISQTLVRSGVDGRCEGWVEHCTPDWESSTPSVISRARTNDMGLRRLSCCQKNEYTQMFALFTDQCGRLGSITDLFYYCFIN